MRLLPRDERFFDLFTQVATLNVEAAKQLHQLLQSDEQRRGPIAEAIKRCEHQADELTHEVVSRLDRSFITPFDREDIHTLATRFDDVLDNLEETAHRFLVFRVERPTEQAVAMARIIQECCLHLEQAIRSCRSLKNPEGVQSHLREVSRLENDADKIYRDSESALFASPPEILVLIKWCELYGWLEATVDACKDLSQVISEIVVKGS